MAATSSNSSNKAAPALTTLLVDASVWLSAVDSSESTHLDSAALIARAAEGGFRTAALDLTRYEVANTAIAKWHDQPAAIRLIDQIEVSCVGRIVQSDPELIATASRIAASHEISVYDAAYVAASQTMRWQLVTCDVRDLVSNGLAVLPADALN